MSFNPLHYGLYFSIANVETARKGREQSPLREAWAMLRERQQTGAREAQWDGYRYRFDDDTGRGENGVKCLLDCAGNPLDPNMTYVDALEDTLVQAHAF